MAVTQAFSGSTVGGGTTSLTTGGSTPSTNTDDGVYQLYFNGFQTGHLYTIQVLERTRSADTQRVIWECVIDGNVASGTTLIDCTPSFLLMNGWDMLAIIPGTTTTTFRWSIRKIA